MNENSKEIIEEYYNDSRQEKNKQIALLLKDLKDASKDLAKAQIAFSRTKGKDIVTSSVSKCKDSLYTAARKFWN